MYLITEHLLEPFITDYFDYENNYVKGMIVYNLNNRTYTTDGLNWTKISIDIL